MSQIHIYEIQVQWLLDPITPKYCALWTLPYPATKEFRGDPGLCTWCMKSLSVDLNFDSCEKAKKLIFHIRLFTFLNEETKEKMRVEGGWKRS